MTLYSDSGLPLIVTPVGLTSNSTFDVSLPSNGSAVLVLPDVGSNTQGWANVVSLSGGAIGGQGTFLYHRQGGTDWEGAVPLTPATSNSLCIIALPPPQTTTTLLPFDNMAGAVAGIGIANLSGTNQAITLEVDGQDGSVLQTDTLNLGPLNHTSFLLSDRYSSLANQKGVLRLRAANGVVGLLGLRVGSTGGFSTLLPISQ